MKSHSKRVINNTFFLYGKLLLSALVTLYSTRLLLNGLGLMEFGIYNLIAGVILMLTFLNGAMTITTQRYLSFYMGDNNSHCINRIFNSSVSIHFLISICIVLILEIMSIWLLNGFLNIPEKSAMDAAFCYHLMVVSTFFTINAVPYDAMVNAKEDMRFDAIIGLVETFLKFLIAYSVIWFDEHKLVAYSMGIMLVTIVVRLAKSYWCKIKYQETCISFRIMKQGYLFKEMLSYASWNLFGSICYVASSQGVAIVLNRFLGVNVNGSYAIAQQMNSQLQSFSVVIGKALNPQIVKSEGSGDRQRMIRLALLSSKSSAFLLLFVVIPLIAEMNGILELWLKRVPYQANLFCSVILINAFINQLSTGLKSAVQATGKIKLYQSVVGTTVILIVPLSFILLELGLSIFHVLCATTFIEIISLILRLIICQKIAQISYSKFFYEVLLKVFLVILPPILCSYFIPQLMEPSFIRIITSVATNSILLFASIVLVGLNSREREVLMETVRKVKRKKIRLSI